MAWGGHFYILVCGCDHAPFLCGSVALYVSLSWFMYMSLRGYVAVVVDGTVSLLWLSLIWGCDTVTGLLSLLCVVTLFFT